MNHSFDELEIGGWRLEVGYKLLFSNL